MSAGSHWINPVTTRVLPVDTLPWTDAGTAYIQCKDGRSWSYVLKQTAKTTAVGIGVLAVGSIASKSYVTGAPKFFSAKSATARMHIDLQSILVKLAFN